MKGTHCDLNLIRDVNEKMLLHGTWWATVREVVAQGFDPGYDLYGLYGWGTYLASDAWKAHQVRRQTD